MAYIDRKDVEFNISSIMNGTYIQTFEIDEKFDIMSLNESLYNINLLTKHYPSGKCQFILYRSGDEIFSVTETIGNSIVIENITAELEVEFELVLNSMEADEINDCVAMKESFVQCFEPLDENMLREFIYVTEGNILYYSHTIENWIYFNFYD